MIKKQIILLSLFSYVVCFSQVKENTTKEVSNNTQNDGSSGSKKDSLTYYTPTINAYKYWKEDQPVAVFDTVLTIKKYYENRMYNHKDSFGTIPFSNIGETLNPLLYNTNINAPIEITPLGKSFNLLAPNEIRYFDVQTPTTEFQYNNGYRQGHSLSSLFTHNINSQFNYSIQYRGLRSEGKYLEQLATNSTFLFTSNYHTKDHRYKLWTHYIVSDINNQENGGLRFPENFESGDSRFSSRDRLEVNLTNAISRFETRRFYLAQQLGILGAEKGNYPIALKNVFSYTTTHYNYGETETLNTFFDTQENMFGALAEHHNEKKLRRLSNLTTAVFNWTNRLHVEGGLKYEHLQFSFDRMVDPSINYPQRLTDDRLGIAGNLTFDWKEGVVLKSQAEAMTGSTFNNSYFVDNHLTIQPIKDYYIEANMGVKSQIPNLNLLYNQSFYKKFNYYKSDFNNETTIQAGGNLHLKPFNTKVSAQFFNLDNYTYLDGNAEPQQFSSSINLLQVGLENSFKYQKFHLETRIAYQKVAKHQDILPLPEWMGRATFYYQTKAFSNHAEYQLGLNAYYFSKFKSRVFFPVVNEFRLQSDNENYNIGEYPILDLFFHIKIKRMLIIMEAQHFNSSFSDNNFYSSPINPYTDFRLNVGILWYIFT